MTTATEPSPFASLTSSRVFPGRKSLSVMDVRIVLRISESHLLSLIDEGLLGAVRVNGAGNKSKRSNYRIPVSEYDRFVLQGGTAKQGTENRNGKAKR